MDEIGESLRDLRSFGSQLYKDWSAYGAKAISKQLPTNLKYTPPKENLQLRVRIRAIEKQLDDSGVALIKTSLSFLESGILEDDFKDDDKAREKFFTTHTIKVGNKEETLYVLAKKVNKLSGNAISRIITTGRLVDDPRIESKSLELMRKVEAIKKDRGYFLVSDLQDADDLALSIIEHILGQHK